MERIKLLRTVLCAPLLCAASLSLTACSGTQEGGEIAMAERNETVTEVSGPSSMEESPVLEYEIPVQQPGIIADRNGYSKLEVKYAWVVASELPQSFYIVNEESGDRVLEITPENAVLDEAQNEWTAKLIFTDVQDNGSYYIEAEGLGQSYSFAVSDTYYEDCLDELLNAEYAKCDSLSASLEEVYSLVYIWERYSKALPDFGADSLQLTATVKSWLDKVNTETDSPEELGMYAAIFAKFSNNYKAVDADYAAACLSKAIELYDKAIEVSNNSTDNNSGGENAKVLLEDTKFLALAELYRCTGSSAYSKEINALEDFITSLAEPHDSEKILFGSMCYMSTKYTVNRNLCDKLMEALLKTCETFSLDHSLLAAEAQDRLSVEAFLSYAQQLVAMNYILDGYQYNELIMKIMHYMNGRNSEGFINNVMEEYPSDVLVIYAWLTLLERDGKMDPSAQVIWNYSW